MFSKKSWFCKLLTKTLLVFPTFKRMSDITHLSDKICLSLSCLFRNECRRLWNKRNEQREKTALRIGTRAREKEDKCVQYFWNRKEYKTEIMGRKKIQIARIMDERNRQVKEMLSKRKEWRCGAHFTEMQ